MEPDAMIFVFWKLSFKPTFVDENFAPSWNKGPNIDASTSNSD